MGNTISPKAPLSSQIHGWLTLNARHVDVVPDHVALRAIHHDPEYYEDPEELIPERFEKNPFGFKDDSLLQDGLRITYGFGAGRRQCPAQRLAENSLV
jgi:hypothetical protein